MSPRETGASTACPRRSATSATAMSGLTTAGSYAETMVRARRAYDPLPHLALPPPPPSFPFPRRRRAAAGRQPPLSRARVRAPSRLCALPSTGAGPSHFTFHQPSGAPVVNRSRFPDFEAMTARAHALGLTAGWCAQGARTRAFEPTPRTSSGSCAHVRKRARASDVRKRARASAARYRYLNNCICADHCSGPECYLGDIVALSEFGFDAVKLDGCSAEFDVGAYAKLIAGSGRGVVIENCHWGRTLPNSSW